MYVYTSPHIKEAAPNHRDRVALSATSSAHFNAVNKHVAIWYPQSFENPVIAEYNTGTGNFSRRKMDSVSHVLFVDILMSNANKYYLDSKDGRTTTHDRDIIATYERDYREALLRLIAFIGKTHESVKNLSFIKDDELTPNVLTQILEAMRTVEYVSLIHCQQFNYETIYSHDVSDSVPDLYLECSIPHNFSNGPLRNANWVALLWVYLQRYCARMMGETLEREEDTDSEAEGYGTPTASYAPMRPPQDQNHMIVVGPSARFLLGHQMKNNPRFLRDFSLQLIGKREGGHKLVENMITGKTLYIYISLSWESYCLKCVNPASAGPKSYRRGRFFSRVSPWSSDEEQSLLRTRLFRIADGKDRGSPKMVENMITGETTPWELATRVHTRMIGPGKVLNPRSNFGRFHHCSDCSQRLSGLSFASNQFKKRDDDPTCMACHAQIHGQPPFRVSDWKLEGPIIWKTSEPIEIHFKELCPINLLGGKCKCPLHKVNRKDPSLYKEKPWLQPTCKTWLEGQCARHPCDLAHNYPVERRQMASEFALRDHALLLERKASVLQYCKKAI